MHGVKSYAHQFAASGIGAVATPAINLIALPVILRTYPPESYGLGILLISVALIPASVSSFKYEHAIVIEKDPYAAGRLLGLCMALTAGMGLLVGILVASPGLLMKLLPDLETMRGALYLAPLLVAGVGIQRCLMSAATRFEMFGLNSASLFVLALTTSAVQIALPRLGWGGGAALVVGATSGYAAAALVSVVGVMAKADRRFIAGIRSCFPQHLARKYSGFPKFSVAYGLLSTLRLEGTKVILGSLTPVATVGYYAFAQRITYFPVTFFGVGVRPVVFSRIAKSTDAVADGKFLRTVVIGIGVLSVPPLVAFYVNSEFIIRLVFGSEWLAAGPFCRVLVMPALAMLLTSWMDRILDTLGHQKTLLKLEFVFSVTALSALGGILVAGGAPLTAVSLMAAVLGTYFVTLGFVAFRAGGYGTSRYFRALGVVLALAGVNYGAAIVLKDLVAPAVAIGGLLTWGWLVGGSWAVVARRHQVRSRTA